MLLLLRQKKVDYDKQAQVVDYLKHGGNRRSSFATFLRQKNCEDAGRRWAIVSYWLKFSHLCNNVSTSSWFSNFITGAIVVASALVGIQTYPGMEYIPGEDNTTASRVWMIMDQIVLYIFTAEVVVKMAAEGTSPWRYFGSYGEDEPAAEERVDPDDLGMVWNSSKSLTGLEKEEKEEKEREREDGFSLSKIHLDFWNIFDFIVVVVCYLPLRAGMIAVIRLFRLLRVLKLVRALPELQVLILGLLGSLTSIFYVVLLLFLVFYFYAIMAVTLLRENDPVHFGDLQITFVTLFRMATLEDWTEVTYTAMLGCEAYNFGYMEWRCTSSKGLGWPAAALFVSFVIVATFVVLNLFIGVINENMAIAKEQLKEMRKEEMMRKGMDDSVNEIKELHTLSKRMKKLHKRTARLHQAMAMAEYDVKTLMESLQAKSACWQLNREEQTITEKQRSGALKWVGLKKGDASSRSDAPKTSD
uniref:Ion transport protein n=1 Tax=Tetraselmis sp. GSL018 TaxID=582737 RepID=A0A061QT60_9CHLO|mmetsp:Transcript_32967/g.78240  ORF Transcript_32967/g.78240 Transcript_32967/m.78240 type:complete len:472 (-) Transcript_32967:283-1698(-)